MKKTVWTFGLISGVILSLMMVVSMGFHDAIGFDKALIVGYTTMVVSFLLVFFGIRSYRDNVGGGKVGFARALAVGSLIVVISSACYVATWQVVYRTMTPDYLEKYQAYTVEKDRREGKSQAEIDESVAEMKRFAELYKNPAVNVAVTFLEPLPVGLLITLLSAAVLSRKRRQEAVELSTASL